MHLQSDTPQPSLDPFKAKELDLKGIQELRFI